MTSVHFVVFSLISVVVSAELQCGYNEFKDDCPATCSDRCPNSEHDLTNCSRPEKCPPPACRCSFNCKRAGNGTCVPVDQCPSFPCEGSNEKFVACPPYCPTDDCSQASSDGQCPIVGFLIVVDCSPACRCIEGYWRKKGICVPYEQCRE